MPGVVFFLCPQVFMQGTHPELCDVPKTQSFLLLGFQAQVSSLPKPTQCNVMLFCRSLSLMGDCLGVWRDR